VIVGEIGTLCLEELQNLFSKLHLVTLITLLTLMISSSQRYTVGVVLHPWYQLVDKLIQRRALSQEIKKFTYSPSAYHGAHLFRLSKGTIENLPGTASSHSRQNPNTRDLLSMYQEAPSSYTIASSIVSHSHGLSSSPLPPFLLLR